jgi:multiple sugar transport system substrate-binding protein
MKKKILIITLLLLLPFVLYACTLQDIPVIGPFFGGGGNGEDPAASQKTLTYWGLWENPEVMQKLIQKYESEHPNVKINYDDRSVLSPSDYREGIFTRITSEGAPDIVRVHATWIPFLKDSLAPNNNLSAEDFRNKFYPIASRTSIQDNKVYAVPLYYDGLVLAYNKDHFAEINQDLAPTAWEEFRKLALELTIRDERGNEIIRGGAAIGNADNIEFFSDILGLMFAQANVKVPDDFEDGAAVDALKFYTNFFIEDKVWSDKFPEASASFAKGDVSMIFIPTWNLLDIIQAKPDMNIGLAEVPQAVPKNPKSWGSFWVETVTAKSPNQDIAWDFLNFLVREETQMEQYSESLKFRQFGAPYSIVSLAEQIDETSSIKPLLRSAPYAETSVIVSRAGNDRFVEIMQKTVNYVIENTGGDRTPAKSALEIAKTSFYNEAN